MNIRKAAENLVAELNQQPPGPQWHSVYIQTRVADDGTTEQVLKVHIRPEYEHQWRSRTDHLGFKVEQEPWPD